MRSEVSVEAARLAIRWCDFLEAHARKVYAAELRAEVQLVEALAERIKAGEVKDGDAVRDVYRKHWTHLDTPEKVEAATKALEALGWLKVKTRKTSGRPKAIIRLHPKLRGEG